MKLTIYTNDTLVDVKRVVEADRLKIPYRVTGYLMASMENLSLNDTEGLFNFITGNTDQLDKIIKATFGVTDKELECIDTAELIGVGMEIYQWGIEKIKNMKQGNNVKNVVTTV